MSIMEFEMMRLPVFFLKLHYYMEARNEQLRYIAELIRLHAAAVINIQLPRNNKVKPEDLWQYNWEITNVQHISEEVTENLLNLLKKI